MRSLHPAPSEPKGWPLFRLGFRPFYLVAAWAAVLLMPLWLLVYSGRLSPVSGLAPTHWHAHEMLFGMMSAVIVGFLFTAGRNWTGLQTPRGPYLGCFVLLWISARVAALLAPYPVFFCLDAMFLPLAALVFAQLLVAAGNHRNLGVAAILALLGLSNLGFHLAASGVLTFSPLDALHAGLALVVMLETVIGGRVIPMFTRNAIAGLEIRMIPVWRERLLLLLSAAGLIFWLAGATVAAGVTLAAAAALHLWRMSNWRPWSTRGQPLLWVLHLVYAWIPMGLVLLAMALVLNRPVSPALHALGVGAGAGLMLAMMTRTARGHTGRALHASRSETWSYRLIMAAVIARVALPLFLPRWYMQGLMIAGALFAAAFLLYLSLYSSWLMSPRVDGRDG